MAETLIPPPEGFTLNIPAPPPGFTLDGAVVSKPKSEPTWRDRLSSLGLSAIKGMPGGPLGIGASLAVEGSKQSGELLDKAAYSAGGSVTDLLAGKVSPEIAGGAGYLANVATQAIPTVIGSAAGKLVATKPLEALGKGLMQSAIKPTSADLLSGDAAKAIDIALKEGVNVSPAGVAELQRKIGALNKEVMLKISQSTEVVDKGFVGSEVFKTIDRFKKQVRPGADVKAIQDAWLEFTTNWGNKIPVQDAQAMKQGTQRILASKYGEQGAAAIEAEKSMARGLRLGIEDRVPEVAKLNSKEAELINAVDVIQRRALMEGNKNTTGLSLLAHHPELGVAMMADRSALFKSILARMLFSGAKPIGTAAGGAAGGVAGTTLGRPE